MSQPFSHCSFCGSSYAAEQPWPRLCGACGNTAYRNPLPVSVVLLPVDGGLLTVRRAIEPRKGQLALPGGFINYGEAWQAAGAREVLEETGISIDPAAIGDFWTRSAPDGTVLVFGLAAPLSAADLPAFVANEETAELVIVRQPTPLAFPLHTDAAAAWFAGRGRR
ncbi:MAG TPA: NUDIX domain-containing protein [Herpetosiphonaceae bacterium]|nr:NUDIX domain-containing protein [Herpetosiphonaceae bacterium]